MENKNFLEDCQIMNLKYAYLGKECACLQVFGKKEC